jgi:hypothetical protein
VQNQAQAYSSASRSRRSDDPNIGATPPDPLVLGDVRSNARADHVGAQIPRAEDLDGYAGVHDVTARRRPDAVTDLGQDTIGTETTPPASVISRSDPDQHDLRREQHDAERPAAEQTRTQGISPAVRHHCDLRAGERDGGGDARGRDQHDEQRRDDHGST